MKIGKDIRAQRYLAQWIFLIIPTLLVACFLLWRANNFFTILSNQWLWQILYYASGMGIGLTVYKNRLRFLPSLAILIFLFVFIYRFLDNLSFGEFDSFFISKQFLVFAILFTFGWICGWGFQRLRLFSLFISAFYLFLAIYLISKTGDFTLDLILYILLPIIFYSVYLIFASNELYKSKISNSISWKNLFKRFALFTILLFIISVGLIYVMYDDINERIENYGGGESNEDNSILKKNKDGSVSNQNQLKINNNNNRSNELIFCAYIDNYFEGTETPNPLYLSAYYFTKFDTLTETFERDKFMPLNDEFSPDLSSIPIFSIVSDKNKISNGLSTKYRKTIEIEVYKKNLAKDAFLAPSTAYEVQPITVEKDYQQMYKYAYRAKSYVSELNSAYFIYNAPDPTIQSFQEERFKVLRNAKSYSELNEDFLRYYTFFPSNKKFSNYKILADSLAAKENTAIDKVLAIRNHFLKKDPTGKNIYSYSDNPGIPGLPGASKLSNFMFETKKGWCTYYAGSTLLLLRAMKIPSRIVVGFLTVDRSEKNKGWYWFYQDQAHAWVQVYFPEYGWLDFDFTVGNDEAQQSPEPDRTPPLQPPKPTYVISGKILHLDTLNKIVDLDAENFLYQEQEFKAIHEKVKLNLDKAFIWRDTLKIKISELKQDEKIMCINYDTKLNNLKGENAKTILQQLPSTLEIDEAYVQDKLKTKKEEKTDVVDDKPLSFKDYIFYFLFAGICLLVLLFLMPWITLQYYILRLKSAKKRNRKAYFTYKASEFYLHQHGYARKQNTLLDFATKDVEPRFNNSYSQFCNAYLHLKFAPESLDPSENIFILHYWSLFIKATRARIGFWKRLKNFLNLNRYIQYFYIPKIESIHARTE